MTRQQSKIRKIVILGGGSAGFLTAVTLTRYCPEAKVTVVQSDAIPPVGVGESTTGWFPWVLHQYLGIDRAEFFQAVQPALKLGIRFEWGPSTRPHFNYTFDPCLDARDTRLRYGNACYCRHDMEDASLYSALMNRSRVPIFEVSPGTYRVREGFGYHVDAHSLTSYLASKAAEQGANIVSGKFVRAAQDAAGSISEIHLDDGRTIEGDLFVDCSGFRSLLLQGTMQEEFVSYASSLYCDSAAVAHFPRADPIQPYTTATTMPAGWCWRIDLRDRISCGYVFSSRFCSDQDATAALNAKFPQLTEQPRILRFRSGRYRNFWANNVVAIGNAGGFVEPLESTGLHMACAASKTLADALTDSHMQPSRQLQAYANRYIGDIWDDIRGFLALHFKFNQRMQTPFWQHCREHTDLAAAQEFVDAYRRIGPASALETAIPRFSIFGMEGYLAMLVGQGVSTAAPLLLSSTDHADWNAVRQRLQQQTHHALSCESALSMLDSEGSESGQPPTQTPAPSAR